MGQGSSIQETEMNLILSKKIESSYPMRKQGLMTMSSVCGCGGTDGYVLRNVVEDRNYTGIDTLFDDIDEAITSTAWSILPGFLIYFLCLPMIALFIAVESLSLFLLAIPISIIAFTILLNTGCSIAFSFKRKSKVKEALEKWNSEHGSIQGVQAGAGVKDNVSIRAFFSAIIPYKVNAPKHATWHDPYIHICRTTKVEQNQDMFIGSAGSPTE